MNQLGNDSLERDSRVQDQVVESIVEQFRQRSRVGQAKYGTTLDRTDLKPLDWIQHAQEELMEAKKCLALFSLANICSIEQILDTEFCILKNSRRSCSLNRQTP
jgi:hypothetical protein